MSEQKEWPKMPPMQVGLRGRCPRCGEGKLFDGFLKLAKRCDVCDLDFSFADPADGPAFFVMIFACIPSAALAVWLEVAFAAPIWVHLITSLPFMLLTCLPTLRLIKGWLVASQYYHQAAPGRLHIEEE